MKTSKRSTEYIRERRQKKTRDVHYWEFSQHGIDKALE